MILYGKDSVTSALNSMYANNRFPSGILLYGDRGVGKRTMAAYIACLLMCVDRKPDGSPCLECRACRNVLNRQHPDVIYPEHSGKLNGFSMETMRKLPFDAYISPNNGDRKLYVLDECDNFGAQQQNTLLKLIEEPPPFAHFVLTATAKDSLLETILSRVISIGVPLCEESVCAHAVEALTGKDSNAVLDAVDCFGGNIGKCIEYLENDETRELADTVRKIALSIVSRSEYNVQLLFNGLISSRPKLRTALLMLDGIVRDAAVIRLNDESGAKCSMTGSSRKVSAEMARIISYDKACRLHENIVRAIGMLDSNANAAAVIPSLMIYV